MLIGYDHVDGTVVFALRDPALIQALHRKFGRLPVVNDFVDQPLATAYVDDDALPDLDNVTDYQYVDGKLSRKPPPPPKEVEGGMSDAQQQVPTEAPRMVTVPIR